LFNLLGITSLFIKIPKQKIPSTSIDIPWAMRDLELERLRFGAKHEKMTLP
jgi:hypothetical protein